MRTLRFFFIASLLWGLHSPAQICSEENEILAEAKKSFNSPVNRCLRKHKSYDDCLDDQVGEIDKNLKRPYLFESSAEHYVISLHGLNASSYHTGHYGHCLAEQNGPSVIGRNLRGHGTSLREFGDLDITNARHWKIDALQAYFEAEKRGAKQIDFLAISAGAAVVTSLLTNPCYLKHLPKVKKVAFLASPLHLRNSYADRMINSPTLVQSVCNDIGSWAGFIAGRATGFFSQGCKTGASYPHSKMAGICALAKTNLEVRDKLKTGSFVPVSKIELLAVSPKGDRTSHSQKVNKDLRRLFENFSALSVAVESEISTDPHFSLNMPPTAKHRCQNQSMSREFFPTCRKIADFFKE